LAEARRAFAEAAEGEAWPSKAAAHRLRCVDLAARDASLSPEARAASMRDDALRAREALRKAVEAGDDPVAPYLLAWFLTTCPVTDLRDPPEAIRIARGILGRDPGSWAAWATLGAAHYRDDDPREAVAALEHAPALHGDDLVYYGFFLAMARHRLDEAGLAREAFDRADRRIRGLSGDDEVRRLRDEAAGVLGLGPFGREGGGTPDDRAAISPAGPDHDPHR
jgi:tetratricopeptide (TPR) repeat protein